MIRNRRRIVPALALLAVAAVALPAKALPPPGLAGGGGAVDADIYLAEVVVPGGEAYVEVVTFRYRGGEASTSPRVSPQFVEETYGCVLVKRGRVGDSTCGDLTAAAASGSVDLSTGRVKFTLPSGRNQSIAVDLTLTATGEPDLYPYYEVNAIGPVLDAYGVAAGAVGRISTAAGTVTSTRAGGGKVSTTRFAVLAREFWNEAGVYAG